MRIGRAAVGPDQRRNILIGTGGIVFGLSRHLRRLHKRPNANEVDQCRWWLDIERKLIRPRVIVGMGTTALRGLLGRAVTISSLRGQDQELDDGVPLVATVHPSSLLRAKDQPDKEARYDAFVGDFLLVRDVLSQSTRPLRG